MKLLLILCVASLSLFAAESSQFDILPGKLHKGGFLSAISKIQPNSDQILIDMVYEIKKKDLVPVPSHFLKGTYGQKLPSIFLDERGYLELEKVKSMRLEEAKVVYLGRVSLGTLNDAHRIHIIPDNKKSEMFLTYHPTAPGLGWDQLKLVLHTNLPILGDYVIEGKGK